MNSIANYQEAIVKLHAKASVDSAIVDDILPQLYVLIDDLLDHCKDAPKELKVRAKKMLPAWAPHSFEQKQSIQ